MTDRPVPRIGLTRAEAAAALGMGLTSFEEHVQPYLRIWRCGKLRIVPVSELERFLSERADPPLAGDRATLASAQSKPPRGQNRRGRGKGGISSHAR